MSISYLFESVYAVSGTEPDYIVRTLRVCINDPKSKFLLLFEPFKIKANMRFNGNETMASSRGKRMHSMPWDIFTTDILEPFQQGPKVRHSTDTNSLNIYD